MMRSQIWSTRGTSELRVSSNIGGLFTSPS
jgi:hypothetical protein